MSKIRLYYKCAVSNCYSSAYAQYAVCRPHLIVDCVLYGSVALAVVATMIFAVTAAYR